VKEEISEKIQSVLVGNAALTTIVPAASIKRSWGAKSRSIPGITWDWIDDNPNPRYYQGVVWIGMFDVSIWAVNRATLDQAEEALDALLHDCPVDSTLDTSSYRVLVARRTAARTIRTGLDEGGREVLQRVLSFKIKAYG